MKRNTFETCFKSSDIVNINISKGFSFNIVIHFHKIKEKWEGQINRRIYIYLCNPWWY